MALRLGWVLRVCGWGCGEAGPQRAPEFQTAWFQSGMAVSGGGVGRAASRPAGGGSRLSLHDDGKSRYRRGTLRPGNGALPRCCGHPPHGQRRIPHECKTTPQDDGTVLHGWRTIPQGRGSVPQDDGTSLRRCRPVPQACGAVSHGMRGIPQDDGDLPQG